jgi:hypothetical protein
VIVRNVQPHRHYAGAGGPRRITRSRIDLKSAGIPQAANEGFAEPAIGARDERNDSLDLHHHKAPWPIRERHAIDRERGPSVRQFLNRLLACRRHRRCVRDFGTSSWRLSEKLHRFALCPKEGWRRVWPIAVQGVYHDMSAADAVDGSSTGATSAIDVVLLGHS